MNIYVALLRGINVGGKNKLDMKLLKKTFERLDMQEVETYINSGNVIFCSDLKCKNELSEILEAAILKDFKLDIKVLIRNFSDIEEIYKVLPKTWENNQETKCDIMFLSDEIDSPSIMDELVIKPDIDTVKYLEGTILWKTFKAKLTKSGLMKLAAMKIYKKMTIRNVNTFRKIYELMSKK